MSPFSSAPCQSCGVALTADSAFCLSCGAKILRDHDTTIGEAPAPSVGGQLEVSWSELESRLRDVTAGDYEIIRELGRGGQAAVFPVGLSGEGNRRGQRVPRAAQQSLIAART